MAMAVKLKRKRTGLVRRVWLAEQVERSLQNDRIAPSIHNKQFSSDLSERAVWFGAVRHLIAHARRKDECPAVFQLRM